MIANTRLVSTCRGDEEVERLPSGITSVLGHGVKKFSGLLCKEFIEYKPGHIETLLGFRFRGKHPVEAVGVREYNPLGRRYEF